MGEGEEVDVHLGGEAFGEVGGRDPAGEGVEGFWGCGLVFIVDE